MKKNTPIVLMVLDLLLYERKKKQGEGCLFFLSFFLSVLLFTIFSLFFSIYLSYIFIRISLNYGDYTMVRYGTV